jgi:hypothetical protein
MRQINRMRNRMITTTNSSETTNSLSINKQSSNDTDKILNIKCESTNDISTINIFSPANLFRKHKQRLNRGLTNKLCKIRVFFDNLLNRSSSLNENNQNNNNNKLHNNLNDSSSIKHHSKYFSIALNLLNGDQGLYENTYCTCGGNNKDDGKICINCFHQGKFQNKQLTAIMATPSKANKSSFEYETALTVDMLNAATLIQNPNYVLYDIPELDETDDNLNDDSVGEYYYNQTEKV